MLRSAEKKQKEKRLKEESKQSFLEGKDCGLLSVSLYRSFPLGDIPDKNQ